MSAADRPDDPWTARAAASPQPYATSRVAVTAGPPLRRSDAVAGVVTAAWVVLLGAPVGLLWWAVAPRVSWVVTDGGAQLGDVESEAVFAADGVFFFLTLAVGVLCGLVAWWGGRRHGPGTVTGLAVGGLGAAVVAAVVGRRVDYASFVHTVHTAAAGTHVTAFTTIAPDDPVGAQSVLLAWPLAAVVVFGVLAWVSWGRRRHG